MQSGRRTTLNPGVVWEIRMVGTRGIEPLTPTMSKEMGVGPVPAQSLENKPLPLKSRARTCLELVKNLLGSKTRR